MMRLKSLDRLREEGHRITNYGRLQVVLDFVNDNDFSNHRRNQIISLELSNAFIWMHTRVHPREGGFWSGLQSFIASGGSIPDLWSEQLKGLIRNWREIFFEKFCEVPIPEFDDPELDE
jgi:hypothetical protein